MPAGYAATTGVESHVGDDFAFELSDLRVAERLPSGFPPPPGSPTDVHVQPPAAQRVQEPGKASRRPSNIIPLPEVEFFYLGLDVTFVGTQLGLPGYPRNVDLEARFFLEAYGVVQEGDNPPIPERHEINIMPMLFQGLNADPNNGGPGQGILRHQLWVQVNQPNLAATVEAPTNQPWTDLFTAGTVFKVAASVKIVDCEMIDILCPCIAGFIEGASMNTYECPPV